MIFVTSVILHKQEVFCEISEIFLDKPSETCPNIYSLNDFPQIWKSSKLQKSHIWVENWSIYTQIYAI